jgi:pimeloyl-ACP methyl ester carboxylesterase
VVLEGVRRAFIDPGNLVEFEKKFKQSLRYRGFHHALLSTLRNMDMNHMQDVYSRVGRRSIPVLLVWGRQDHVLPFENSQRVLAAIPAAAFRAVDNSGHNLNYENPDAVNSLLRNFLR